MSLDKGRSEGNRVSLLRCGVEVVGSLQAEDAAGLSGCGSQQQESGRRVGAEPLDRLRLLQQQDLRGGIAGIADGQTHNLGRISPGHAEIEEVLIFGHQNQALLAGRSGAHGLSSETAP